MAAASQDSLESTSLEKVSRLQPAEEIGGWILQSSTPPPPSMTCMSPYFLTSVSAGLKMLCHKFVHYCGNKDVLGPLQIHEPMKYGGYFV